ncbi:hypothetical protein SO802_003551 [Lithocarpus litseifolius]|uniref:Uncharacterized protein n=1 Tax=Lithocarpus litseifolius TaxID=425828 RepID=A0AAW2E0Z7_9ROSI
MALVLHMQDPFIKNTWIPRKAWKRSSNAVLEPKSPAKIPITANKGKLGRLKSVAEFYAAPVNRTRKNLVTVPGLFKKTKGVFSTPASPIKVQEHTTTVQPPQNGLSDMERVQPEPSMSHSMGSVTKGQLNCSPEFEQQQTHTEPLENGTYDLQNNSPINEALNDFPPLFKPSLLHTQKETDPIITPIESVHQDSFLSELAEIDEGLSQLNAKSALNSEVTREENSSHVLNTEVRAARVCHAQGSEIHTTLQSESTGKQEKKQTQQQRAWKRVTNQAVQRSTNNSTSKEVFEQNINGRESGPDQLKSLTKSSVGLDMTKEACSANLSHH